MHKPTDPMPPVYQPTIDGRPIEATMPTTGKTPVLRYEQKADAAWNAQEAAKPGEHPGVEAVSTFTLGND